MSQQKTSLRQIKDAALAPADVTVGTPSPRRKNTRPETFVGDRPGFFRGAAIRRK